MLFNSVEFVFAFFPIVTLLYFLSPHRFRWALLLAASCFFYMAFVPKYVLILFLLIGIDYIAALLIEPAKGPRRRTYLLISLAANVGILALFKYFNFINGNVAALASAIGWRYPIENLQWLLPVGLSFHTFQAMAYTIEVYRGNQPAERHLGLYALYVMFYPQLVAGPIERPQGLLPQFREKKNFDYDRVVSGLQLMTWGFFKKVFVADRLAILSDAVYSHPHAYTGWSAPYIIATYCFAFQIYCDFSGYSDIARGSARVMGFELMENFKFPYIAGSVAEFWQRWHISLSSWFRDYLYLPLLYGTRDGNGEIRASRVPVYVVLVFLVSGFWHGAGWTFGLWGASHGLFIAMSGILKPWRLRVHKALGLANHRRAHGLFKSLFAFHLIWITWVLFRAESLADAGSIMGNIFGGQLDLPRAWTQYGHDNDFQLGVLGVVVVLLVEKLQRTGALDRAREWRLGFSFSQIYYATLILAIALGAPIAHRAFIYLQF